MVSSFSYGFIFYIFLKVFLNYAVVISCKWEHAICSVCQFMNYAFCLSFPQDPDFKLSFMNTV